MCSSMTEWAGPIRVSVRSYMRNIRRKKKREATRSLSRNGRDRQGKAIKEICARVSLGATVMREQKLRVNRCQEVVKTISKRQRKYRLRVREKSRWQSKMLTERERLEASHCLTYFHLLFQFSTSILTVIMDSVFSSVLCNPLILVIERQC